MINITDIKYIFNFGNKKKIRKLIVFNSDILIFYKGKLYFGKYAIKE